MKRTIIVRLLAIVLASMLLSGPAAAFAEDTQEKAALKAEDFRTVGNIVTFGYYEQDNNADNGQEPIEWIVLDVDGNKALLLSKYGLEVKQYNTKYIRITWEKCTLRKWLNDEFISKAFTEEEQSAVLLTDVDNSQETSHSRYQANSGNNTQDRVFCLSYAEANRYLGITYEDKNNVNARVAPTPYALARGAWVDKNNLTAEGKKAARWWLRSPGRHPNRASHILPTGAVRDNQCTAGSRLFGFGLARPAMWVDLGADIF